MLQRLAKSSHAMENEDSASSGNSIKHGNKL